MRLSEIILTILVLTKYTTIGGVVYAKYGRLTIDGYPNCTITNNGVVKEVSEGTTSEFYFGLVYYQCGPEFGYVISRMTCMDCGIYCAANDYIEGCQNKALQMSLGIGVGILMSILLYLILHYSIVSWCVTLYHYMIAMIQRKSDERQNKHAERINKLTAMYAEPVYKEKYNIVKFKKAAYKKRGEYPIAGMRSIWNPMSNTEEDKIDIESEIANESVKAPTAAPRERTSSIGQAALITALLASNIASSKACDMNFYFQSEGSICDETKCHDINMYTFPITYGQSVCFRDGSGEITSFTISNAYERIRYNKIYQTSDIDLMYDSTYSCESKDECTVGSCRIGVKHTSFQDQPGFNHYGCMTTSSECDTYCFWKGKCVYYHWWAISKGPKYDVYEMVSKIWEIRVVIKGKEGERTAVLNVNNPSINMEFENAASIIKVPMIATSVDYEQNAVFNRGVVIDGSMTQIMVSDSNNPISGMVGDVQVEMKNSTNVIIDPFSVTCQVDNCKVMCVSPRPTITRIVTARDRYRNERVYRQVSDKNVVETRKKIQPTVMMGVGNFKFQNLLVKQTKCDINVDMTFGCVGCGDKPYIVTTSTNIDVEGLVEFESNCTFDKNYLSCSNEPYVLSLEENYNYCRIDIKRLNTVLNVTIDYSYVGLLSPIKTISGKESFMRVATSMVTSKSFVETTVNTVTTCTILGTSVAIVTRIIRAYFATKVAKDTRLSEE